MSAEKKVLLLFLSLIILIVVCVSTHLPSFMKEENTLEIAEVEKTEIADSQKVLVAIKDETKLKEEKTEEVEVLNSENIENTEEKILGEDNTENKSNIEEKEEVIINEVPEIPLITTDERYTRSSGEKRIEELSKKTQELQIKIGDYVKENPVAFTRGSFKLTKKSNKTIEIVVEALKEFKNLKIEVAGHTDAIGARALNQTISLKRAEAVKQKLISLGIDKDRIIARGYGEDIPFVKNSVNGYSKVNRRVEFNIIEE